MSYNGSLSQISILRTRVRFSPHSNFVFAPGRTKGSPRPRPDSTLLCLLAAQQRPIASCQRPAPLLSADRRSKVRSRCRPPICLTQNNDGRVGRAPPFRRAAPDGRPPSPPVRHRPPLLQTPPTLVFALSHCQAGPGTHHRSQAVSLLQRPPTFPRLLHRCATQPLFAQPPRP